MSDIYSVIQKSINRAELAAFNEQWYKAAPQIFETVFAKQDHVVAGDIWDALKEAGFDISRHRSAMGALFRNAEKAGAIERVDRGYYDSQKGNTPFGHSPVVLWTKA